MPIEDCPKGAISKAREARDAMTLAERLEDIADQMDVQCSDLESSVRDLRNQGDDLERIGNDKRHEIVSEYGEHVADSIQHHEVILVQRQLLSTH